MSKYLPVNISSKVRCYSHILNPDTFNIMQEGKTSIFISEIENTTFKLTVENKAEWITQKDQFIPLAHISLSTFLIAINVASLGLFVWDFEPSMPPLYIITSDSDTDQGIISSNQILSDKIRELHDIRNLEKNEISGAALLWIALVDELDENVRKEYSKGLYHIIIKSFDVDFIREAFGNFYRALEYFITRKILKVKNLKNDKKQIEDALLGLGLDKDVVEEFGPLYIIRSENVMHAQKTPKQITIENVLKMKLFLDAVMHRYYKPLE